jgi:uroporphyrinogen decarboxylase
VRQTSKSREPRSATFVDAVQIFDTWAGILPAREFDMWCIRPHAGILEKLRAEIPGARMIGFPRGAGTGLARYLDAVAVDAVGLDWIVGRQCPRRAAEAQKRHRSCRTRAIAS